MKVKEPKEMILKRSSGALLIPLINPNVGGASFMKLISLIAKTDASLFLQFSSIYSKYPTFDTSQYLTLQDMSEGAQGCVA